jgi:hypothetical protein
MKQIRMAVVGLVPETHINLQDGSTVGNHGIDGIRDGRENGTWTRKSHILPTASSRVDEMHGKEVGDREQDAD